MRTLDRAFIVAGIASLSMLVAVSSCDINDSKERVVKPTKQSLEATIESEQWKVTYFSGEQEATHHFNGFTFQFLEDGSIMATQKDVRVSGVWSTFNSNNGQLKLNMEFDLRQPLDRLNEDWVVVERTDSRIILNDVAPFIGVREKLMLEKV